MDTPENLVVIGRDPALFDSLKDSVVSSDFRMFYCGLREDQSAFIREHEIRFVLLDAQDGAAPAAELLVALKRADRLLTVLAAGRPIPINGPIEAL